MKLPRRRQFLHLAAGAAALPTVSRIAWGQAYPSRPTRIIVGFPAGGQARANQSSEKTNDISLTFCTGRPLAALDEEISQ